MKTTTFGFGVWVAPSPSLHDPVAVCRLTLAVQFGYYYKTWNLGRARGVIPYIGMKP